MNVPSGVKRLSSDVYIVNDEPGFRALVAEYGKGLFTPPSPESPSVYPSVVFLYVKYHGGDDFIVSQAVPVGAMFEAVRDL